MAGKRAVRGYNLRDQALTHAAWVGLVRDALTRGGKTVTPAARGEPYHLMVDGRPLRVITDTWMERRGNIALELAGNFEAGQPGVALQPVEWWAYVNVQAARCFLFHLPTARRAWAELELTPTVILTRGHDAARAFHTLSLLVPLADLKARMAHGTWAEFDLEPPPPTPAPGLFD